MEITKGRPPGLKIRKRADGVAYYWIAKESAVAAGYPVKTVNLDGVHDIPARCRALEAEMLEWLGRPRAKTYDGTLGALLTIYASHEESPYRALKPSSLMPYDFYLGKLHHSYGSVRLANLTGLDIKGWHKVWRSPGDDGKEHLGAASMALAVLKAAFSFGFVSGFADCARLREVCKDLRLPSPMARDFAPTAADVARACAAAHDMGHPRAALAYAFQFETTARQWDITGKWVAMSDPRPSAVTFNGRKWFGPTFSSIDANGVLTIIPSKTERTTRAKVHVNLTRCPMVTAELAKIAEADRHGPLVVNPDGRPYNDQVFTKLWRAVRERAGLPEGLWNRDLRAGGVTEAEMAGASAEDRAKLAGHSKKVNEDIYSRDRLAASDRVVEARERFRSRK